MSAMRCALGIDKRNQLCIIENPTEAEFDILERSWEFWVEAGRTVYTAQARYSNIRELVADYIQKEYQ